MPGKKSRTPWGEPRRVRCAVITAPAPAPHHRLLLLPPTLLPCGLGPLVTSSRHLVPTATWARDRKHRSPVRPRRKGPPTKPQTPSPPVSPRAAGDRESLTMESVAKISSLMETGKLRQTGPPILAPPVLALTPSPSQQEGSPSMLPRRRAPCARVRGRWTETRCASCWTVGTIGRSSRVSGVCSRYDAPSPPFA